MKKQVKITQSHLRGLQLLHDRNLQRKNNKPRQDTYEVLNDRNWQTKHASPSSLAHFQLTNYDVCGF